MRALLAIVVLASLGWSGWWYVNAQMRQGAIEDWLAERRADGWVAELDDLRVRGFPNRIDTVAQGLRLADPASDWSWAAPEFQILSLSYQPHHVIAVWPGTQVVASPYERVEALSESLRGSVVFAPDTTLALERAAIEIDGMAITGATGWQAAIGSAMLAVRRTDPVPATPDQTAYEVSFRSSALSLPDAWRAGIDRAGVLPETIETALVDTVQIYDRPWDRAAVEGATPRLQRVRISDLRLSWGRLDLRGQGTLDVDAEGFAEGEIELRARNWREMLEIAEASGAIGSNMSGAVRTGLELLARFSGDPDVLELPLTFADGRARLGPIGIGAAPRLARRAP